MIHRIVDFSLKNKLLVFLFFAAWISWGIYESTRLPIDAVPDITNNQVQVISTSQSLGASDIERLVTVPLEIEFSNIPGIKELRSFSRFGLSIITVVFTDETDVFWARQQITERISRAAENIPSGVAKTWLAPVTTGLGEVYQYVVKAAPGFAEAYSLQDLRSIQDWIIRKELLGTEGVADVSGFGGEVKQYQVLLLPERLKAYGVSHDEVIKALEGDNQNTGGAYIEKGPKAYYITTNGLFRSLEDIGSVPVKMSSDGMPVLLRQVAEVSFGAATRYGAMSYGKLGEVSGAVVMMTKGENSSQVVARVKKKMEEIRQHLPPGVVIEAFLDRSKMVNNAIHTVETNLMEGALIVVLILVLFLSSLRAGIIVASVIPIAMLFAIILMNLFHISGNLMSLGALDFGLIIDGAVIIVEAVMHSFNQRLPGINMRMEEKNKEVGNVSSQMMNAAFFGQVIIFIVYIPILTLQGIEGKMFVPMAQTVAFALLGAIIASLTWVPVMCAVLIKPQRESFADRFFVSLRTKYAHALEQISMHRLKILAAALLLLIASFVVLSRMGGEFIPRLEEGDFAMETRLLTGASLSTSVSTTQRCADILLDNFPEIEKVVVKTGCGEIPTDPMPIEGSDAMIILKDKKEWSSAKSFDELAEKMKNTLSVIPGVSVGFQFPVQMRFNELMTGAKQDVVCKIYGDNLDSLSSLAERVKSLAEKIKGVSDIYVEKLTGVEQLEVIPHKELLARYGISLADFNRALRVSMAGENCGFVYENERRYDLVVKMKNARNADLSDIQQIQLNSEGGQKIPLSLLADIKKVTGPNQIMRESARRRILIGFNIRGRDVQTVVTSLQQKIKKQLSFPSGYSYRMGGSFENLNEAKQRLAIVVPLALLLIFLLLYFSFGSMLDAAVVYMAIPFSAVGGILFLAMRGMPFSISAAIGFIALFGVAVLNGVVLIAEIKRLRAAGNDFTEAVLQGAQNRLRPILMTATVASFGFLPMALSNGAGAEVQRPLATVVIGGLVSATFLTLFLLPMLYEWIHRSGGKKNVTMATVILVMFMPASKGMASETKGRGLSYREAWAQVLKSNLALQKAGLEKKAAGILEKTWLDLPAAQVGVDYGQFNTFANDNRLGVQQSFSFPGVYLNGRNYLKSLSEYAVLAEAMDIQEKKRELRQLFNAQEMVSRKLLMWQTADSLWTEMQRVSAARTAAGVELIAEGSLVTSKKVQIKQQLLSIEFEVQKIRNSFQCLLHTTEDVFPVAGDSLFSPFPTAGASAAAEFTGVKLSAQAAVVSAQWAKYQKGKLMPEFFLNLNTQSNTGWFRKGNEEVFYPLSHRFWYGGGGVLLPLFYRSKKSQWQLAKTKNRIAEVEQEAKQAATNLEIKNLLIRHSRDFFAEKEIREVSLPAMQQAMKSAMLRYKSGETGFTECMYYYNEYLNVLLTSIEYTERLNNTLIDMEYYYNR